MKSLDNKTRAQVVAALVEGNSIRATVRMTGVSKNTIVKLLENLGMACAEYQDKAFRNLTCRRIQCDEIWSFVGSKAKNVSPEKEGVFGYGDVWTWVSMDADTKLVPCWLVGSRNTESAMEFIHDLAGRLANKVQLTTDGHRPYLEAVESAFGGDIDYAQLVKIYGASESKQDQIKYSPAECVGCKKVVVTGTPRGKDVSTSYIERQNLTMRMSMRRFTRLTNGFSKKVENHAHAIALHYMYYNFCRIHRSLRVTPAMAAGVTSKLWEIEDILRIAEPFFPKATKRGSYKKRISD
ncbi:MAG: IS1 family transposase [Pyrinomonadaceae bacterium]